ncbi:T9SS type A sorting domain-containing protein [Polaribacter sp. L3A8]|uniref:T9SS type A sorting domain-containing protein n=1 Tax=Polaribacter sp. L3A8 TaxID=2686361 RepID=UPI00131E15B7|nr:T9SS type A sorting domain-containing protein [Polaribacter sp. L3A8]
MEDYDIGGEGFAFHDSIIGNTGGAYRTEVGEDVDISAAGSGFVLGSLSGGEFTRYTIDVAEAGSYQMLINYKRFSSSSKPFSAKILTQDLSTSKELFSLPAGSTTSGIVKIGIGVFGDYTSPKFDLQAGKQVLELYIPSGGAGPSYDFVTLEKVGTLSTTDVNILEEKLKVFPVPSNDGKFNLNKSHQWKVYSILGSLIIEGNGKQVDISSFSKGMYLLKIETGENKRLIYR